LDEFAAYEPSFKPAHFRRSAKRKKEAGPRRP